MKKIAVVFIIFLASITQTFANSFPEVRLTFYLDATQSMLPNRWDESKKCLIEAINAIEYEKGTYVKICVFADAGKSTSKIPESSYERFVVFPFTQADASGKRKLCSFVNSLEKPGQGLPKGYITLTNLDKPLMDFINNQEKNSNTKNVMILITDGRHETSDNFAEHLRLWHDSTSSNTYGVVVGIGGIDGQTKQIIDSQKYKHRLRGIEQKDDINLNFKFLSIECPVNAININETKTFNLNVSGNTRSALEYVKSINLRIRNNTRMTLEAETYNDTTIQVKFCNCNLSKEPEQQTLIIEGNIAEQVENECLVFLLNDTVSINCINSFSRTLNIYHVGRGKETEFKQDVCRNLGTIEYYKPCHLLGSKEKQVPAEIKLKFKLNEDALGQHVSAKLAFTNGEGELLDSDVIRISKDGNFIDSIEISKAEEEDTFTIEFSPKKYRERLIVGGIKLYKNEGIDSVNGIDVKGKEECVLFSWQVKINSHINPRLLLLIWILIVLICLFLLACYIIWHHREFSLRFPTEGRIVFEPVGDNINIRIAGAIYRGNIIVPNAIQDGHGSDTIYTEKLNHYYIKEIIVGRYPNLQISDNSKFKSWDRIWNGDTIYLNCDFTTNSIDHIVLKPVGTITREDISLDVYYSDSTCINIVIPIHLISPKMPDTDSKTIDNTNIRVLGRRPLNPIYRDILHRSINSFINIFNH